MKTKRDIPTFSLKSITIFVQHCIKSFIQPYHVSTFSNHKKLRKLTLNTIKFWMQFQGFFVGQDKKMQLKNKKKTKVMDEAWFVKFIPKKFLSLPWYLIELISFSITFYSYSICKVPHYAIIWNCLISYNPVCALKNYALMHHIIKSNQCFMHERIINNLLKKAEGIKLKYK